MLISNFYQFASGQVSFTRQQGSDFAKQIADDFNPIHNTDAKRFCIPGDLLFSVILANYGCSEKMHFSFSGMVTDEVILNLPSDGSNLQIVDDSGKEYLSIDKSGYQSNNDNLIDSLTRSYVSFSGQTVPHILVPLMKTQDVMLNPSRPMAMYKSMLIDLDNLDFSDVVLELDEEKTHFEVNGKRGTICLAFKLLSNDTVVGRGEKHMVVSGLQPYDESAMNAVIAEYEDWKRDYHS